MSTTANRPAFASVPTRDWLTHIELTALGAIWGASFLFMRVAAPEFGPMPLAVIRLALGALVLLPLLWQARGAFTRRDWWQVPLLGVLNSAVPFALFAWATQRAPAGIGAITNSMTVLFTSLVAFVAFGEKIGARRAIALLAGFSGVVVLASGRTAGANITVAALAGTLAALCYGISANLIRRYFAGLPPVALAAGTLVGASSLLAPFAITQWPEATISGRAWFSALLLGTLCTGLTAAFYFRLIARIGAPRAVTVTYLIPLFGVGWSWLLLGETPTLSMVVAATLILGSVAMSHRPR
ncbi:MAG: DMT family transporter [Myxococcaceae bacterium]|nr:DMT family transporter [Myxococcaceae bacterium]MCI0672686.1 DMT family transporter [Myxococcaceae bacterium]